MTTLYKLISIIGLLIGYTADVIAQYGAPMSIREFEGKVVTKYCDEKPGKIKVEIFNRYNNKINEYGYRAVTTSNNGMHLHSLDQDDVLYCHYEELNK